MLKKIGRFLALYFFICQMSIVSEAKPKDRNLEKDFLFSKENVLITYEALFFINENIKLKYLKEHPTMWSCDIGQGVYELIENKPAEKRNILKNLTLKERKLIKKWHIIDGKIKKIMHNNLKDNIYFEDVIFYMKNGKHFFDPYISWELQYDHYESIGESALCDLYYDVFKYLLTANQKEFDQFFEEYIEVYKKIANGEFKEKSNEYSSKNN